jgi:hypothetical protein
VAESRFVEGAVWVTAGLFTHRGWPQYEQVSVFWVWLRAVAVLSRVVDERLGFLARRAKGSRPPRGCRIISQADRLLQPS